MKIGFVVDDTLDKPDGVQQYVFSLSKWLIKQGHEVHYLVGETSRTDIANIHSLSKNVSVRFNKNRLSIPLPASKRNIEQLLTTQQFDVLHVQMPHNPFLAARVVRLASKKTAIVGTFHIAPFSGLETAATRFLGHWLRKNLKLFDAFISVSEPARVFAKKTFKIDSQVLPNVVDVAAFKVKSKPSRTPPQITYLGRLVPRKGCRYLLEATAKLQSKPGSPRYKLQICGDGQDREKLHELHKSLGVNATFTGQLTEQEKKEYLAAANIAVFPSLGGESFGIVLLEAMAAGAGVVLAGDNPGYRSVMESIPECLVDPTDVDSFATKLQTILIDKALADDIHTRQQVLVQQYDINTVGPRLLEIYNSALLKR